ncbi:MAG TPA: SpoIIE family protein phosphatase [Candidatus Acidoferrales bacterium]|nr:SpoIIE family protein phosphatase [Candidatus Acidoferrales bacterium]
MATVEQTYLHSELLKRRERLQTALSVPTADASLAGLLKQVDSALEQMSSGTYGLCEACHESIEPDRLLADPLLRFCVDHLTSEERRALEGDLGLAARIQRGLLPKPEFSAAGWNARYHYEPLGVVSGDYCDLVEADGALNFLLGDVAGKGVAASMLMSHLHATFRSLMGVALAPAQLLESANRIFCESTMAGQYATLVYGRASASGEVELVSAGHCPVLVVRGKKVERLDATGVPLGMFCGSRYSSHRTRLEPNNHIVLYTDGLSEARNSAGEEYGLERISAHVSGNHHVAPASLLETCLSGVREFSAGAPRGDDMTVLVLQRAA